MNDAMHDLLDRVESAILAQKTGDLRNLLCDCNISIQNLQYRVESYDLLKEKIRDVIESEWQSLKT